MKKRFLLIIIMGMLLVFGGIRAQDGLNLPSELYVLLNNGVVQRYGLGAAGVVNVTPDDVFILDFAVAPDNDLIAYRTETGLNLLRTSNNEIIEVEADTASIPPLRGSGETMVWTNSGNALAYTTIYGARVMFDTGAEIPQFSDIVVSPVVNLQWSPNGTYLAAEVENNVWWIYRRDGTEMLLASALTSSIGTAWVNDSELVFAPEDGGLFLMDLANANQQVALRDTALFYRLPVVKPDGSIGVFVRDPVNESVEANAGFFQQLGITANNTVTTADPSPVPVTLDGLRWAPGGDLLIQFQAGAISLVLPFTGDGFVLPVSNAVAYGWGAPFPANVTGFTTAFSGFFLAPDAFGISQVWLMPRNGTAPQALTELETPVTDYAVMDSGAALAFVSDRGLWFLPLDPTGTAGNPTRIGDVDEVAGGLDFSADGGVLTYSTNDGVWVVEIPDGQPAQIFEQSADRINSEIATSPNLVLVSATNGASTEILIIDTLSDSLTPRTIATMRDGMWLSDGRVLGYEESSSNETMINGFSISEQNQVAPVLSVPNAAPLDVREVDVGVLVITLEITREFSPSPVRLVRVAVDIGEPDDIATLGYITDPAISPDGSYIAGYSGTGGALTVIDVAQGSASTLISPVGISNFQWATFR